MPLEAGTHLGPYVIEGLLGSGGMGDVYRARDTRHGRTVAIKVLGAGIRDDPDRRERFLRDARAAAALSHPNIAALYETGEDQGQLFLAFEFVPGVTLQHVIGGRALNPRRAIDFAVQIADALADAHAENIVHRDLKPANVIITPKDKAKVLDFGFAAWTSGGAERERALSGAPVKAAGAGSPASSIAYLSPEQTLGEQVDQRTDIFSLGVIVFEMLTGTLPFHGADAAAVSLQILQAPAPPVSAANRAVPKDLDAVVAKALAKSLDQRYQSAATCAAELRSIGAILDVRSDAAAPVAGPTMVPRRRSSGAWIVGALLLAAAGAAAWYQRAPLERLARRTIGPSPLPVVAVVPLALAGADASKIYFADGFTEDLMSRLGQTPGVKVLARSAARADRGKAPAEVARAAGAAVALTGSVAPGSDSVAATIELIDARDGTPLWTKRYTKELKDIFAMEAQIAGDVAVALRLPLQPTRAREVALARVADPRAYDAYLRGRQAAAGRRTADALRFYEQATAADAGLGEAFAGIAEAVANQIDAAEIAADATHRERLQAAARRAYEIDPDLPQANLAMGRASDALADSLKYFRHAIEVDPSLAEAYHLAGEAVDDFDPETALALFAKSSAIDPRFDGSRVATAAALWRLGRDEDARAALKDLSPGARGSRLVAGMPAMADLHAERYAAAVTGMTALPDVRSAPPYWAALIAALRGAGRADEAVSEATALFNRFPQDCGARTMLAALRFERRDLTGARRLADGPLAAAARDSAAASELRCGLHASAALQDGARAAALLDRVSAAEPTLRAFARPAAGRQTGTMWLDIRTYPWSTIARQPAVAEARERLEAAYARERDTARAILRGLP
jgi:eukaryotic-like serine/threonine-protein kinase